MLSTIANLTFLCPTKVAKCSETIGNSHIAMRERERERERGGRGDQEAERHFFVCLFNMNISISKDFGSASGEFASSCRFNAEK